MDQKFSKNWSKIALKMLEIGLKWIKSAENYEFGNWPIIVEKLVKYFIKTQKKCGNWYEIMRKTWKRVKIYKKIVIKSWKFDKNRKKVLNIDQKSLRTIRNLAKIHLKFEKKFKIVENLV